MNEPTAEIAGSLSRCRLEIAPTGAITINGAHTGCTLGVFARCAVKVLACVAASALALTNHVIAASIAQQGEVDRFFRMLGRVPPS